MAWALGSRAAVAYVLRDSVVRLLTPVLAILGLVNLLWPLWDSRRTRPSTTRRLGSTVVVKSDFQPGQLRDLSIRSGPPPGPYGSPPPTAPMAHAP